jgi:ubiquinone/menaquinone biosynthesis C-methylase UbiE
MPTNLHDVLTRDLERIVRREAFHWGNNAAESYFDPAARDMDRQWAVVEPFLSRFPIDYSNTMDLACGRGRSSEKLASMGGKLTLVDVNEENIAFCVNKFAGNNFSFLVNNGFDLHEVADHSITFMYCFEAAVHFDLEIILSYIKEFGRVLVPGGFGFIHHSNFTGSPGTDFRAHPHSRNFMSKDIFVHLCTRNGLEIVDQRILNWGGCEADCFSLFRNTVGLLRSLETSGSTITGDVASNCLEPLGEKPTVAIRAFEPATKAGLFARGYLLANPDLRSAFGHDEGLAQRHFYQYGVDECRYQFSRRFLSSRREKFIKFKGVLREGDITCFPARFGRSFYKNETYLSYHVQYSTQACQSWNAELELNPSKLYTAIDMNPGVHDVICTNCVYIEVDPVLTADILIERICNLPFKDASLDGIGCFAALGLLGKPQEIAAEFTRVLKPGGRIFIDWPVGGHYFNRTEELQAAFSATGLTDFDVHDGLAVWLLAATG